MKRNLYAGHRLNAADTVTLLRIAGTILLMVLRPLSLGFFCVYALTGLTDALDGWIARSTHTASDFGARLDSIADLLFYAVMLVRLFPLLWNMLPRMLWHAIAWIVVIRLLAYSVAAIRYRRFASLHTYMNKLTGIAVFLIPFLLSTAHAVGYCRAVCVVAAIASLEELVIHLRAQTYRADMKFIFQKECRNNPEGRSEHENSCS